MCLGRFLDKIVRFLVKQACTVDQTATIESHINFECLLNRNSPHRCSAGVLG